MKLTHLTSQYYQYTATSFFHLHIYERNIPPHLRSYFPVLLYILCDIITYAATFSNSDTTVFTISLATYISRAEAAVRS